jgi:hypothetical protein
VVTHEYDPETGLNWITILGPVTTCLVCHRLLAGDCPVVCDTCATEPRDTPLDDSLWAALPAPPPTRPRGHRGG